MDEKEFDSSVNEYAIDYKQSSYIKKLVWDMAIGLQEVDNLKPSKYLLELKNKYIVGDMNLEEVKEYLKEYYNEKKEYNSAFFKNKERECDFVSTRIVELLNEDYFELSVNYLKYVHKFLFQDIYDFAGEFRKVDFSKHEKILNNDSVAYGYCETLSKSLEYDFFIEKEKKYENMNITEVIKSIATFSSNIWQVHPFREGNTRTTAIFIEKYLISLGYTVDNTLFKNKSIFYRNALVRSNYFNNRLNVKENHSFLIKFYENLLLGKNNNLNSEDLIVSELFNRKGNQDGKDN